MKRLLFLLVICLFTGKLNSQPVPAGGQGHGTKINQQGYLSTNSCSISLNTPVKTLCTGSNSNSYTLTGQITFSNAVLPNNLARFISRSFLAFGSRLRLVMQWNTYPNSSCNRFT